MTAVLQPSLDDLGTVLSEVTFCVVDLETTGSGPDAAITEVGAVRVRGGEVTGEFQTLVNPDRHVPALISVLTGITDTMVANSPRIDVVLPQFLEFARGCVIVAHNARFDVGFLRRACELTGRAWPSPAVVDTVALARCALLRDEVPNHRLSTLAAHLHATVTPDHRALSDARATVDVLHALIGRVGSLGVWTLEDLQEFMRRVTPQRRRKRILADGLPECAGVYLFVHDAPGRHDILYVGTSRNIRRRVRTYFTAAETRSRMDEMVRIATGVESVPCTTVLEASVLELRLIAAHRPRYNRRSKDPRRQHWLKITVEPVPRLSVVSSVLDDGACYFGPFHQKAAAQDVVLALYDAFPVRRCTQRLSVRTPRSSCAVAELGHCPAPCELGDGRAAHAGVIAALHTCLSADPSAVFDAGASRLRSLARSHRYEEAAEVMRRLATFEQAVRRFHRVSSIAACPQLVAARRIDVGWEIHVIRHGRLAGAAVARAPESATAVAQAACACAETVTAPIGPQPAATIEEAERIADWLEQPGVRFIDVDGEWAWPLHAGHRLTGLPELADPARLE